MSTHAAIITKTENGYAGIYCHNDGYPEHVGRILKEHYTDPKKVAELIALGDISSLGSKLSGGYTHSYSHPDDDTVIAYCRDRGEERTKAKTGKTWREVADQIDGEPNTYIFDGVNWSHRGF